MANNRKKRKINSKQANIISLIISGIYFIYMLISGLISKPVGDFAVTYWSIDCVVGTLLIYVIFYILIFKGEVNVAIKQCLSTTDYKQVYLLYESCDIMNMITKILQKEGCKFYAKLTEDNNVHLIVKDKHDEEVYSTEIENPFYFDKNFKFDE